MLENRLYLPRRKLPERYNVTPMTIYRWERDRYSTSRRRYVNGKKFYDVDELEAWERRCGDSPLLSTSEPGPGSAAHPKLPPKRPCGPLRRAQATSEPESVPAQ